MPLSNLQIRVIAGFIFFPALLLTTFDAPIFSLVMCVLLALSWNEYLRFRHQPTNFGEWINHYLKILLGSLPLLLMYFGFEVELGFALVAFSVQLSVIGSIIERGTIPALVEKMGFYILGICYLTVLFSILVLVQREYTGRQAIWFLLFVVGATDTGAYFVGKRAGKSPFFQNISPSKTQEGLLGGIASGIVVSILFYVVMSHYGFLIPKLWACIVLGIVISVISAFGDLFESMLKRFYGVKDSGSLIPGHGGILDRFDGVMFGVLPLYFFIVLRGGFR